MRQRRGSGQVVVELAIVFPLLVFLALAVLQFALYMHGQNVVTAAAEDAARVYAQNGNESKLHAQAEQHGIDLVSAGLGKMARNTHVHAVPVPAPGAGNGPPDHVDVMVTTDMRMILPWNPFGASTLPLSATASMSKEHFRG